MLFPNSKPLKKDEKLRKKQEEFTETVGMLRDQNNDNIDEI